MKKAVLVTGCSSGIGLCIAQDLRQKGFRVFATARQIKSVETLNTLGFEAFQLDLADSGSIVQTMKVIHNQVEALYGLIHNGAYGQVGALEDISREVLEAQFQTNVFGWHELTNLALSKMKLKNQGRIVYISSVLGFVAMPFRGAYNASKFAIEGLAATLRLELKESNIQLSLIQPGPIESNFRHNAYQAFQKNINIGQSDYLPYYKKMIQRLKSLEPVQFSLSAQSVADCAYHALNSKRAKIYYRVTLPTKLFFVLIKILPSRIMDKILSIAGGGGAR
jgi:short-subunit dehydrogenase